MSAQLDSIKVKVGASVEVVGAILHVTTMVDDQEASSEIYFLEEQPIRDALIKLGWTPPQEKDNDNYV